VGILGVKSLMYQFDLHSGNLDRVFGYLVKNFERLSYMSEIIIKSETKLVTLKVKKR